MTERSAARAMDYAGEPLSVHPMFASGKGAIVGLRSASSRTIEYGDGITVAIGYWGGLTCRAGTMSEQLDQEYLESMVIPYYQAVVAWYETVGIGQAGGHLFDVVTSCLQEAGLSSMLNPGHAISLDEWLTSAIRANSSVKLPSGVALQCDIIPRPMPDGAVLNCEDTVALADDELRGELADRHPSVWNRIEARRAFMQRELRIELEPDVLPLSSCPAYFPPGWLDGNLVCVACA